MCGIGARRAYRTCLAGWVFVKVCGGTDEKGGEGWKGRVSWKAAVDVDWVGLECRVLLGLVWCGLVEGRGGE